jgi:hypothetical protein
MTHWFYNLLKSSEIFSQQREKDIKYRSGKLIAKEQAKTSAVIWDPYGSQVGVSGLKRQQKHKPIIVHYTYERRFVHYKSKIHQICNASFQKTRGIEMKLIVGTRNNPNVTDKLVRRSSPKPKHEDTTTTSITTSP